MERDDLKKDDFIGKLISEVPLDCPSDDFIERVMASIAIEQVVVPEEKSFYYYLRKSLPYAAAVLLLLVVYFTSDLQVLNHLPGSYYFTNTLIPYLLTVVDSIIGAFSTRFITLGLLTGLSAGMLFLIDRFFSRRMAA